MKDDSMGTRIALIVAMTIGIIIGNIIATNRMKNEAVKHNAAYFDSKTAKFKWRIFKK